ncbi:MAG: hypothetical protein AAFR18_13615 [Cyanobacteria bacterium J06627_32]
MIGGIFETIGKTLGVGKEKYFLELDDAAEESVEAVKASVASAVETVTKTAKETSKEVAQKTKATAAEAAETTKVAAENVSEKVQSVAPAKKNDKKAKKVSRKKAPKGKQVAAKHVEAAPEKATENVPQPAAPAKPSAEDLIVAAIAAESKGQQVDSDGNIVGGPQTFSTDYLMTPIRTRRRTPGPSLSEFKGMAKEVNLRLKG